MEFKILKAVVWIREFVIPRNFDIVVLLVFVCVRLFLSMIRGMKESDSTSFVVVQSTAKVFSRWFESRWDIFSEMFRRKPKLNLLFPLRKRVPVVNSRLLERRFPLLFRYLGNKRILVDYVQSPPEFCDGFGLSRVGLE